MQATFSMHKSIEVLFADMPCLHGIAQAAVNGMGHVWADHPLKPACAVAAIGDFILCAGEPGLSATHMLRVAMQSDDREWLVYAPGKWADKLPKESTFTQETRWAFQHDVQPEDARLRAQAVLPAGMTVQPIAGEMIDRCRREEWSQDFVREFGTDEAYAARGLGVLLMLDGRAVAGASSYVAYPGGIEIQVQTRDGYEGRGLATVASAQLILRAHECGLEVSWDAANPASAHLAEKLGYRPAGAYDIFVLRK